MWRLLDHKGEITRPESELRGVATGVLWFNCPICRGGHSIRMPFGPEQVTVERRGEKKLVWKLVGGSKVYDLTLTPSIVYDANGCHGNVEIEDGWIKLA